jgi:phosphate transport system permease protein
MSSDLAPRNDPTLQPVPPSLPPPVPPDRSGQDPHRYRQRKGKKASTLHSYGEPMVWLTGGALGVALFMILGLLLLVVWQGVVTFWPEPVVKITTANGDTAMGQVIRSESFRPDPTFLRALTTKDRARAKTVLEAHEGELERRLVRIGNFRITGEHFAWVDGFQVAEETKPPWAVLVERQAWGRFYGIPAKFLLDGQAVADTPETIWAKFHEHHGEVRDRREQRKSIEQEMGRVHARLEEARLSLRGVELRHTRGSDAWRAAEAENRKREIESQRQFQALEKERKLLDRENDRYAIAFRTFYRDQVVEAEVKLVDIVRAFPANQLTVTGKLGLYFSRWFEFLFDEPREANSEGGVWPAIFGTVVMTLIMCIFVVPFGVLAALYLREYARAGFIVSAVRIAINNLAGVPSIVFGVFGLGFFCYIIGASLDDLLFEARLPNPTYGKGGVLWASLTLALLTLPVVIVATEEALAAVPGSMREGSYACGASKWQTIQRIVLPRAMPGIMTGMILAMARGAGEVAPLMLVGAVKLAPDLPVDSVFPYLHPERSFMHLGFHIYDLGFQSQNSEAARPMVFTTTLLLIAIVAGLNLAAIGLRARLRRKFVTGQF